jgi:hypothetical protein
MLTGSDPQGQSVAVKLVTLAPEQVLKGFIADLVKCRNLD